MAQKSVNIELFRTFFKIGGFTLGGGAAMVPMMEREIVEKHQWLTKEEFLDIYAVSQVTPGIFAVDMASSIENKKRAIHQNRALWIMTFSRILP